MNSLAAQDKYLVEVVNTSAQGLVSERERVLVPEDFRPGDLYRLTRLNSYPYPPVWPDGS